MLRILLALILSWPAVAPSQTALPETTLLKALRDELDRSVKQLRIENLEKPYFVSYRVVESNGRRVSATFGALTTNSDYRARMLAVEVRVGDYNRDNTNFFSPAMGGAGVARMYGGVVQLPLEDDYKELRRQTWLATDSAYKKAVEDFSKKRAVLQTRNLTEDIPDFSREPAATAVDEMPPMKIVPYELEKLARATSALFREMPEVAASSVQIGAANARVLYLNSEGTAFSRARPSVTFTARAATQAADGMPLEDFVAVYGRSMQELPAADLMARVRELGVHLKGLTAAGTIEQYNGPVLFDGQAAAELFSQVFAPNLVATRRQLSDNPGFERFAAQAENPFVDKIGARVLPEFLSVSDNPAAAGLAGSYKVDDDGIAARETKLVEKGMLRTLVSSRNPVRGVNHSSGNRRGADAMLSNVFVSAGGGLTGGQLRDKLLAMVKQRNREYGVIVRRIGNPSLRLSPGSPIMMMGGAAGETRFEPAILAYKVFPDGREELARNVEIAGLSAATFKEIVAASKDQAVYTAPFRGRSVPSFGMALAYLEGGSEGGATVVSFTVPSFLFEDVTLKKPSGEMPKPPVAKHPFFDK